MRRRESLGIALKHDVCGTWNCRGYLSSHFSIRYTVGCLECRIDTVVYNERLRIRIIQPANST